MDDIKVTPQQQTRTQGTRNPSDGSNTGIYSTQTTAPNLSAPDEISVCARIAAVLAEEADRILPVWCAALRGSSPFYDAIPEGEMLRNLRVFLAAYQSYFSTGDFGPFVATLKEAVRQRFHMGFPLVEMEKNVGAVRKVALPFIVPAMQGSPSSLLEAMDAMMTIEEICFVEIAEEYQAMTAEALRVAQEAALQAERDKVEFCRGMARIATHDKLILCDHEDISTREDAFCLDITCPKDVRDARHAIARHTAGWSEGPSYSLQLCVGEAGANALRHAGAARFEVWSDDDEVTFRLSDTGPGIEFARLPDALRSGFSTGSTLGMGFTLMLDVADQVRLATDHQGTTVEITLKRA